jgi:transcriptional regulator with XRE-family HTH domain
MTVFDNIKKFSKKRGYSLQTTAEKSGLSKNAIYQYNHGKNPSLETLAKIAKVLGVSIDDLLGEVNRHKSAYNLPQKKPKKIDLKSTIDDEDVIMTFEGREIQREDLEVIKRLLRRD